MKYIYTRRKEMANSTGSYGVFFVDLVDGAVAVVGVVSTIKNWLNMLRNDALTIINRWTTTYKKWPCKKYKYPSLYIINYHFDYVYYYI